MLERFSHKNMPKFYGVYNTKETMAVAMQMALHGDALDFLNSTGPMSETAAALVFSQLCRVLTAAHKNGISHRDVKLENVRCLRHLPANSNGPCPHSSCLPCLPVSNSTCSYYLTATQ